MDSALFAIQFFLRNKKVKNILKKWNGSIIRRTDVKSTVTNDGNVFMSFVPATYLNCPLILFTSHDPTFIPCRIVCDLVMETYQRSEDDSIYTTKLSIRCLSPPHFVPFYRHGIKTYHVPNYERSIPKVNTELSFKEMSGHLYCALNHIINMDFALDAAFSYIDRYSTVYAVNNTNQSAIFCAAVILAVSMQAEIGDCSVNSLAQLVGCLEWPSLYDYTLHVMETIGWRL